jgi:hypothetical protein
MFILCGIKIRISEKLTLAHKKCKMKIFLVFLVIVILVFLVVQFFAIKSQKGIETYPYSVIKAYGQFEIRKYEASLFTSVTMATNDYKVGSRKGFSILAGYIFGGNKTNEKISMTSPVTMSLEDSMTMMFMVPKNLKKENLPEPNQPQIEFKEVPAKTVAAISFKGWANSDKIEKYKRKLTTALDHEGIAYSNHFFFLGYNPPYEVLNRKNEVVVELK